MPLFYFLVSDERILPGSSEKGGTHLLHFAIENGKWRLRVGEWAVLSVPGRSECMWVIACVCVCVCVPASLCVLMCG